MCLIDQCNAMFWGNSAYANACNVNPWAALNMASSQAAAMNIYNQQQYWFSRGGGRIHYCTEAQRVQMEIDRLRANYASRRKERACT